MELVRADGDLRAEAELPPVVEAGARVDEHHRRVDLVGEARGGGVVLRNDGLGVAGAVLLDVVDRLGDAVHDADGHREREELLPEVGGVGGADGLAGAGPDEGERAPVAADLDSGLGELRGHRREQLARDGGVDEERVERVAHVGALRLGVVDDALRLADVCGGVDVDVDDSDAAGNGGHGGVLAHVLDEALPSARDEEVEVFVEVDHLVDDGAVGVRYELHGLGGYARLFESALDDGDEGRVGVDGLLAAAHHDGVARLEAEARDVGGYVGAALVDAADHAERHAPALDADAVAERAGVERLPDGVGQQGDGAQVVRHSRQAGLVEEEASEHGLGEPGVASGGHIERVGLEHGCALGVERVGDGAERCVLAGGGELAELARGYARGLRLRYELRCGGGCHLGSPRRRGGQTSARLLRCTASSPWWWPMSSAMRAERCPAMTRSSSAS